MADSRTPADELREAAELMRDRANAATPGPPWKVDYDTCDCEPDYGCNHGPFAIAFGPFSYFDTRTGEDGTADAEHIASWHPTVALAVADWLESVADRIDRTLPRSAVLGEEPTRPAERNHAFTVARAYLGTGEVA